MLNSKGKLCMLIFIWACSLCTTTKSQPVLLKGNYTLQQYNTDNQLPQNTINAIEKDENGFIWLGTQGGLVRWDGQNFKTFTETYDGGINVNRILFFRRSLKGDSLIAFTNNFSCAQIRESGVYKFKNDWLDHAGIEAKKRYLLFQTKANYLFRHSSSESYALQMASVSYINGEKRIEIPVPGKLSRVVDFVNDSLFYWDGNQQWFYIYKSRSGPINLQWHGDITTEIAKPGIENFQILLLPNSKIVRCNNRFYSFEKKGENIETAFLFECKMPLIQSAYYDDAANNLLLGTTSSGLYVIKKNVFTTVNDNSQPLDSIYKNQFYAQFLLGDSLIISYDHFGYNLVRKTVSKHPFSIGVALFQANDQTVWCQSTDYKQLNHYTKELKHLASYPFLKNEQVRDYAEMKNRSLLVATDYNVIAFQEGRCVTLISPTDSAKGKPVLIESIKLINDSMLWVGTQNGLYEYNFHSGAFSLKQGMQNTVIRYISVDTENKTIWLCSYGQGFFCYRNKKFTSFPIDKNGYLKYSHCLAEDKSGFFWIPTNKGLFQVSRKNLLAYADNAATDVYYYYWNKADGFLSNEFNGGCRPAYIYTRKGLFSLPSANGLVLFSPDTIAIIHDRSPIVIDGITADNKPVNNLDNFSLDGDFEKCIINVKSAYFGNPLNHQIQYRIMPGNSQWTDLSPDGNILINRREYGKYTLEIKKKSGFEENAFISRSIKINILPRWFETNLFRILMLLALVLFILISINIGIRIQTLQVNRRNAQLQIEIDKKTLELSDMVSSLQRNIREKELLFTTLSHDIKGPLNFSYLSAREISEQWDNLEDNDRKQINSLLTQTLAKTSFLVNDFLTWLSFTDTTEVVTEKINVAQLLELVKSKYGFVNNHQNLITVELEQNFFIESNARILEIIIGNVLENANKYTNNGSVRLTARANDRSVIFSCTDTGRGMSDEQINKIMLSETQPDRDYRTSFKLGYTIIKYFSDKIGGSIEIISKKGKGTTVNITIPNSNPNTITTDETHHIIS